MKPFLALLSACSALALSGCNFGPNVPQKQSIPLLVNYSEHTGSIGPASRTAGDHWWQAFGDPGLTRLIVLGASGNLGLKEAEARIAAADGRVTSANAGFFPTVTLGAKREVKREIGSMRTVDGEVVTRGAEFTSKWLIDLFGEVYSQARSAEAKSEAARASLDVARLALVSDLSAAYVDTRYYQELSRVAERRAASFRRTLGLVRAQRNEGLASDLDVARAETELSAAEAEVPIQEANVRRAANRAATLVGRSASEVLPVLKAEGGQPLPVYDARVGVPADLLRNRPDVRVAELEFQAAAADIGYAWSQLFPSISLNGSIAPSYISTDAKSGTLNTWSFGPTLRLPIFEGGRLTANVGVAEAEARAREVAWRQSVLKAVEEVENALVTFARQKRAFEAAASQVSAARRSYDLSQAAYKGGVTPLFEALDAERRYFESAVELAEVKRQVAREFIDLNVAVGRGLAGPGRANPQRVARGR